MNISKGFLVLLSATILYLPAMNGEAATMPVPHVGNNIPSTANGNIHYQRIIITGNCPFGVLLANAEAYKHVVGVGPWAFLHSNMHILRDMKPDIGRITTSFINKDYTVNMESLLDLHPDIIYYYGQSQDDHLERAGVPVVNLDEGGDTKFEPMKTQVYWENKFEDTLGLPRTTKFQDAWSRTFTEIRPYVNKIKKEHIKALYLEESDGNELKVSGPKTFGDTYLHMAGMENVASNLKVKGDAGRYINVSMEQIMKWNPDVIFVVFGSAKSILGNKNRGQDWSNVSAFKNKKIFSTPVGLHNWGGLSAETPLLPLFMINKLNPDYISDKRMRSETKDYYMRMFNYAIPDKLLNEVLSQQ
ncbi:ABC transporter substrate-binding protein [Klebsiella aerogenes]|uniref:ABC transporter substrate-binding protein n=1 Tax=Klebsiella aerogenes TaxID=548 RepID=UPI001D01339D|nr:ABC transporter substrate-binding protein [Klebsiella aerogenes]